MPRAGIIPSERRTGLLGFIEVTVITFGDFHGFDGLKSVVRANFGQDKFLFVVL